MLRGKNVVLRPVRKSDLEKFVKWFNDTEIMRNIQRHLPLTEMEEEKWISDLADQKDGKVIFVIEILGDSEEESMAIGNCGFHEINHKNQNGTIGIAIGEKDCWGRGYGAEALGLLVEYGFSWLNLNRVSSSVIDFNQRSLKMHKKVGFQEEGRRRQYFFRDGGFHDEIILGLLRQEWLKNKKIS